jgi:uncharacterized protein (TIGR02453 family)
MAAYIARDGRKSICPGYYFHMQPNGESLLAGGLYCMDSKMVKAARRAISDNAEEFLEIVGESSFKDTFVFAGDRLKRMPLGFEQDSSVAEYLKYKDFTVMHKLPDDFFNNEGWEGQIVEWCKVLKPYNDFMNAALDDYYNV